jgi:alkanesulfonate monooxygenase SsuD/methylene tetrahydromethanopterin reductase-like flavin-dependent oxidoreductase (luciferase family)
MRIGILITLLPLLNPVDVAEQISTLDVITGGRFIFGIGLGYRDIEFEAFGVDRKEKVARFNESIELIRLLWTKNRVTYAGKHFKVSDATLTNKPIQSPHPPIWMAANSDAAVVRTAKLADTWIVNPHASLGTLERQVKIYKEALARISKRFPKEFPALRELYVAPTTERAFQEAAPHLESKYRIYSEWGQERALPTGEGFDRPFEELAKDRFIIGNPQDCIESINKLAKTGINHCIFRMYWPRSKIGDTVKSVKLLARKVMPYFKERPN